MKEGILSITERVIKHLSKGEQSVHAIATDLKIHWNSAIKALEFLERIGIVKERKGKKNYKHERLFSIK